MCMCISKVYFTISNHEPLLTMRISERNGNNEYGFWQTGDIKRH